eukprot:scaffold208939_cov18-Prasinocladus_malaysianus.AAC.1
MERRGIKCELYLRRDSMQNPCWGPRPACHVTLGLGEAPLSQTKCQKKSEMTQKIEPTGRVCERPQVVTVSHRSRFSALKLE